MTDRISVRQPLYTLIEGLVQHFSAKISVDWTFRTLKADSWNYFAWGRVTLPALHGILAILPITAGWWYAMKRIGRVSVLHLCPTSSMHIVTSRRRHFQHCFREKGGRRRRAFDFRRLCDFKWKSSTSLGGYLLGCLYYALCVTFSPSGGAAPIVKRYAGSLWGTPAVPAAELCSTHVSMLKWATHLRQWLVINLWRHIQRHVKICQMYVNAYFRVASFHGEWLQK